MLWIKPVDQNGVPNGTAREINKEVTDAPTWSGDGKHLLYLSNGKLRLIAVDGSDLQTIPFDLSWKYEVPATRTIIHAGRLWDGRGAGVQTDVDIIVVNDRIQSVEPHRERNASTEKARLVDASSLTVIPVFGNHIRTSGSKVSFMETVWAGSGWHMA